MVTFGGSRDAKDRLVMRIAGHAIAGEIRQGMFWLNGVGGCAVGCMAVPAPEESKRPSLISGMECRDIIVSEFGLHPLLVFLIEGIFEKQRPETARTFLLEVVGSLPVGVDLKRNAFIKWAAESKWAENVDGSFDYPVLPAPIPGCAEQAGIELCEWLRAFEPEIEEAADGTLVAV